MVCALVAPMASRPCRREPPLPVAGCACTVDTTLCLSVCMLYAHVFGMASIMFMMIPLFVVERATVSTMRPAVARGRAARVRALASIAETPETC